MRRQAKTGAYDRGFEGITLWEEPSMTDATMPDSGAKSGWLTRHYGVLCLGWPGVQPKPFPVGEPIHCRYRVWIHRGRPDAAHAGQPPVRAGLVRHASQAANQRRRERLVDQRALARA